MWTLIIWLNWTNPAITAVDNIPTAKDCSRIGDSLKEAVQGGPTPSFGSFRVRYLCVQKEER